MCFVVASSTDIATRQFSSSFASSISMIPLSTMSLQVSSFEAILPTISCVRRGLPLSTTMSGRMTLPALRLM